MLDTSGQPQPRSSSQSAQSAAQQPSGGAANVPGNLPELLVSQPDLLTQQVQAADTSSAESPQALASQTPISPGPLAPPGTTVTFQGTTYNVSGLPNVAPPGAPPNYNPNSPAGVIAYNQWLNGGTSPPLPPTVPTPTGHGSVEG